MLLVHITDECREDAKRHGMVAALERVKAEAEERQSSSAFDQFPKPYFVKKKFGGRQGRLIAAEKILDVDGETYNVLVFLKVLIRSSDEYDSQTGFGHDPVGYGKKKLLPQMDALDIAQIVRDRMRREPVKPKPKLSGLEQMFLRGDQKPGAANDLMLGESKNWVDKVVQCEDLLPRLKDQILEILDVGASEADDYAPQIVKVTKREDYEIAYQWLENGRRLFLYDLVKDGHEPDGAISRNGSVDIQRYLYREYPDWMLYDDKMWNELEKDRFGNFSLSPEESRILHPSDGNGVSFPLFINGRAGSGKSTVLQYLYAEYFSRYVKVGREAGRPPAYFACNHELIRSAVELVKSILLHNPKYCGGADAEKIKEFVNENAFADSFHVYHEYLLSRVPTFDRNRFFPERRYLDYARFAKQWEQKFGKTLNAGREYGVDISWHVIRTYVKGMSMDDFLDKEDYVNIPKNQQSVTVEAFERVYQKVWTAWYKELTNYREEDGYWDDQDLVRYVLDNDLLPHGDEGFLGIFCDESQDFTHIELESFLRMSVYSGRSIYPHEISSLPFVFAGDPYQTLNPTGFRWEAVKAAFTEKFVFGICPIADKVRTDFFSFKDLQNNYRSLPNIVRFGNSVQMLRGAKFQIPDLKPQLEWKADVARPISYFAATDEHFWKEMLAREGVHVIVPCHANEEFQFIRKDPTLSKYVQIDEHSGTTKPPVFSSVRAKGLEFPCVIAYGFGESLSDGSLLDMNRKASDEERAKFLPYEYFLNRLYVAVSRPRSQLYIVDTEAGKKKLWRFAESLSALKGVQMTVPHSEVWDEHVEPLQAGTAEHLDSEFEYNPEELAERFEKTGLSERDAAMMNYAAQYYQEAGKRNKVVECQAMALLFNKEYASAAKKFTDVSDFRNAGDCWWECGTPEGWTAMEKLSSRDPGLRTDVKYAVARALAKCDPDAAERAMKSLLERIRAGEAGLYQSEKWVFAVTSLVEFLLSRGNRNSSETMKAILELVESGVCKSSEKYAEAMLANGDVETAKRFYEFAGVSKGAKYLRTMFVTTEYPNRLSFFNADDPDTCRDTIESYLKNKDVDLCENSWRSAVAAAFIRGNRIGEAVDVIAGINDQAYLRNLDLLTDDKSWKARLQEVASVAHLRMQSSESIAQSVLAAFDKNERVWFYMRVLARIANTKGVRLDVKTSERLRQKLRDLNVRWRKALFTVEERDRIVPIGEFGIVLEKFGHKGDAAGIYRWHYDLTKDKLVARRWFEIQTQTLPQRHGQEASKLRGAIKAFSEQTGMSPRSSQTASELFDFDWDSLVKDILVAPVKRETSKSLQTAPDEATDTTEQETVPESNPVAKPGSVEEPKPVESEPATVPGSAGKPTPPGDPESVAATAPDEKPEIRAELPPSERETSSSSRTDAHAPTVPDSLKLTFFSAKGRLNIEDQDSGSQWNISAKGVVVDGEAKGHVTKMRIEKTSFCVSTSPTQIVLSDEHCGYEFTIKL